MDFNKSFRGFLLAFLILSCNSQKDNWTRFENEYFSLDYPSDWQIRVNDNGSIEVEDNDGSRAVLWPIYLSENKPDIGQIVLTGMTARFSSL